MATIAIAALAFNLAGNLVLIPWLGILGAALATVGGAGLFWLGHFLFGQRDFQVPLRTLRLAVFAGLVATAAAIAPGGGTAIRWCVVGAAILAGLLLVEQRRGDAGR